MNNASLPGMELRRHSDVTLGAGRSLRRRDFLRGISLTAFAAGALSWRDLVSLRADDLRRSGKACILLWMQGGPSQFETFSPKPGHANGGGTQAISTSVPGIEVSENFPAMAKMMREATIIRSMTSKEGAHPRATFLMHTGYLPTASIRYPSFGSIAARELGSAELELPAFVRIGADNQNTTGAGFLGVEFDPFAIGDPTRSPANTVPATDLARYDRRLDLLSRLEADYASSGGQREVAEHQRLYRKAQKMIESQQMKAFDLGQEPESIRKAYGEGQFAQGCLLARRLVESGVPFIEVTQRGWDTHNDNFAQTKQLASQVDQPFAQLLADLKQRGMLDSTLVVWMGEFGRTPRVNPRQGRDHFPRAFNAVVAGGGTRGGQVIGRTNDAGSEVVDRPVAVNDFFQTLCHSLAIDPAKETMSSIGRPIKIVDGGQPIAELFS